MRKKKTANGYFKGFLTIWIDEYDKKSKKDNNLIKIIKKFIRKKGLYHSEKKNGIIVPYFGTEKEGTATDLTEFKDNNNIQPNLHQNLYGYIFVRHSRKTRTSRLKISKSPINNRC